MSQEANFPYLHGFSKEEQARLRIQAGLLEHTIFKDIDLSDCDQVLEIGCGVGAQSEILLRRFPRIKLHSIDFNPEQLSACKDYFKQHTHLNERIKIEQMDAQNLDLPSKSVDAVFLCWVLEHIPNPSLVLSEARRVLKPGGKIYITEVMNHTFFLEPYSANLWKYWMAFNDYQYDNSGDPFVGAKVGNFLLQLGYQQIRTSPKTLFLDNRQPDKRQDLIEFWMELLLSASQQLISSEYVSKAVVSDMIKEVKSVAKDPNAAFMYTFMQAFAVVP